MFTGSSKLIVTTSMLKISSSLQTIYKVLDLELRPGSHKAVWVIRVVQKDSEDKDSKFESFFVWIFLHGPSDVEDLA